ncbi:MAG: thiamine pyrophosphate-binding protein [Polyangiaceae bacterium]|nr:thiamine pyrophosphate-binding protein [Polyangiaceae bacterium]
MSGRAVSARQLLSGNEAVALSARCQGFALGTGYPGTPSSEILERFSALGGRAQWAPNEKVALEVGLGAAFAGARVLVTMKHVGLNVAADVLFTAAYTGVSGALVIVSADDPGMASSQNEQDNRRYAVAAGVPMLEPSDSQSCYDLLATAAEMSERWALPVLLRMTTRICHSKTIVRPERRLDAAPPPHFERDIGARVMVPANARPAHRRLCDKLASISEWAPSSGLTIEHGADRTLGIVASGVSVVHALEAAPQASILELRLTHPLPLEVIRRFSESVGRCQVVEEGDPYLVEQLRAAGIKVEDKPAMYRFGELDAERVGRIVARDTSPEPVPPRGKPPELCKGCPHRSVFEALAQRDLIVSGDIGCYTLAALPPLSAMDTCVCMGASITVGLGLRHVLPPHQARRVVSVIGDSTFVHSGLTGLAEMVYNRPSTGHVVVIVDNGTTAMTGMQEHPGTGRKLDHSPTAKLDLAAVARAMGVERVVEVNPTTDRERFERELDEMLDRELTGVLIARRPCLLAAAAIRRYEQALARCDAKGEPE